MNHHVEFVPDYYAQFDPALRSSVFFDPLHLNLIQLHDGVASTIVLSAGGRRPPTVLGCRVDRSDEAVGAALSGDRGVLGVRRSGKQIDFVEVRPAAANQGHAGQQMPTSTLTYRCKDKANIQGFYWTGVGEVVVATTHGLDFIRLVNFGPIPVSNPNSFSDSAAAAAAAALKRGKAKIKNIKSIPLSIAWHVFSQESRVVLCSLGGGEGRTLQAFLFGQGTLVKLQKFDLEARVGPGSGFDSKAKAMAKAGLRPVSVSESDVWVHQLFGRLFCIQADASRQEIVLYQMTRDFVAKRHVLNAYCGGVFRHNVVDNLLLVHTLDTGSTVLFDIKTAPGRPIAPPLPMATASDNGYGPGWEYLQPGFVLDPVSGRLHALRLNLPGIASVFPDTMSSVNFLLKRTGSKPLLLDVLRKALSPVPMPAGEPGADPPSPSPKSTQPRRETLGTVATLFDMLNSVYSSAVLERVSDERFRRKLHEEAMRSDASATVGLIGEFRHFFRYSEVMGSGGSGSGSAQPSMSSGLVEEGEIGSEANLATEAGAESAATPTTASAVAPTYYNKDGYVIVDQSDIYSHVLAPLDEAAAGDGDPASDAFLCAVVIEYIRSLNYYRMPVQHYLYEHVIGLLVRHGKFYQLHQYLQYHVVSDSVAVAYQLLALDRVYPPAHQLALDMLKRLGAHDEIIDVLLSKGKVLAALRFARYMRVSAVRPAAFLEAAVKLKDPLLFHSVFLFFVQQNQLARGSPDFLPSDQCGPYVAIFNKLFGAKARARAKAQEMEREREREKSDQGQGGYLPTM